MAYKHYTQSLLIPLCLLVASCSFNPFRADNQLTGSPAGAAVGAGAGAGMASLLKASPTEVGLSALVGGAIGYYVTTLRFASGGVMHAGGHVYTLGDFITIEIPSDQLFEVNTAEFSPGAGAILDSAIAVLNRAPENSIMISGNTSGFYTAKYELKISEDRARQVSAYFWSHGVNNFRNPGIGRRSLTYVGYGNFFPIANNITNTGIRQNSRIQITSYPCKSELHSHGKHSQFYNIGAMNEPSTEQGDTHDYSNQFPLDGLPSADAHSDPYEMK